MSLSMQGSGRECWENSPRMDMRDPYSRDCPAPRSDRGAERISDRRERSDERLNNPEVQSILSDSDFGRIDPTGWYPRYKNCVQHFIDHSQHTPAVQSIAAFINIRLPCQHPSESYLSSSESGSLPFVSLRPYIRRLIVTAQDSPSILQGFFGGDWEAGIGCIYKQERANYLFTAKSSGWAATKAAYDISPDEQTPFLRPLRDPSEDEIRVAEARWSEWLAMEDWMVGARTPF
ncbi:unnamed protein product [Penicillium bialowiezense]